MNKNKIKIKGRELEICIRDDADASVAAEIFKEREYRIAEQTIEASSNPIVDVGAHVGFFSLYAKCLNPTVEIFAFEPEPNNIEMLHRHLADNKLSGITVVEAALSKQSGTRRLVLSKDSHNHRLLEAGENEQETITVQSVALSDFQKKYKIGAVGLLKIDIEGGEYEFFENLTPDEFRSIEAIIMEYHNDNYRNYHEIETKLRENGFSVQVHPSRFDSKMGFLFALNKRKK